MACLDTTFLVDWLRGIPRARQTYEELKADAEVQGKALSVSIITLYELEKGARMSSNPQKDLDLVRELISELLILELDQASARIASELYFEQSKKGRLVGEFDIMIASTCIAADEELVTRDTDFDSINKLMTRQY